MAELLKIIASGLVPTLVPLLAFDAGLSTTVRDLRREMASPSLWRALAVALIGSPALAMVVAKLVPLSPLGQSVVVLMGISPGAPLLMNAARSRGKYAPLAVALAVALSFAAVFSVPLSLLVANRVFPFSFYVSARAIAGILVPSLWIPLAIGLALRHLSRSAAQRIEPIVRGLFAIVLTVFGLIAVAMTGRHLADLSGWAWGSMIVITLGNALFGALATRHDAADRTTIALAVVLGNPAIALLVARTSDPGTEVAPFVVLYALVRAVLLIPYRLAARRRHPRARDVAAT
jgi:bile acid:Na+ symporter, BASS family